ACKSHQNSRRWKSGLRGLIRTGGIRMDLLVQYKWGIFITLEVLSIVSLLVFCGVRYFLAKRKLSTLFIFLFLFFLFFVSLLLLLVLHFFVAFLFILL